MRGRPAASQKRNLPDTLLSAAEKCWHEKKCHLDVTSSEAAELTCTHSGMVNHSLGSRDWIFPITQIILSPGMAPLALSPVWPLTDSDANPISANREAWIAKVVQLVRQGATQKSSPAVECGPSMSSPASLHRRPSPH